MGRPDRHEWGLRPMLSSEYESEEEAHVLRSLAAVTCCRRPECGRVLNVTNVAGYCATRTCRAWAYGNDAGYRAKVLKEGKLTALRRKFRKLR